MDPISISVKTVGLSAACLGRVSVNVGRAIALDLLGNFPEGEEVLDLKQPVRCRFIGL